MDYFYDNIIDLNLPIFENASDINIGLNLCLFLGNPKIIGKDIYGDSIVLTNYDKIVSPNFRDLQLTNLKHDIKISESQRENLNTIIFADTKVPMQKLNKVIKLQRSINSRKIYLVGKATENAEEKEDLRFLLLEEEIIYKKEETVSDWIRSKN